MFELVRFMRYARRFERAFVSNDWRDVRRCFADDAVYAIHGAPPFDGETRGGDAIVALFEQMLDDVDRRFDRRLPKLTAFPRSRRGVVTLRWSVRYVLGGEHVDLPGTSVCTFADGAAPSAKRSMTRGARGKIVHLDDTVPADATRALLALCANAVPSAR
jgi:hypothetical protein